MHYGTTKTKSLQIQHNENGTTKGASLVMPQSDSIFYIHKERKRIKLCQLFYSIIL